MAARSSSAPAMPPPALATADMFPSRPPGSRVRFSVVRTFDGAQLTLAPPAVTAAAGDDDVYDIGNYLGGGSSGVVYEATHRRSQRASAMKLLQPLGYRLVAQSLLRRYLVGQQGLPQPPDVAAGKSPLQPHHVWWLVEPSTRQVIAAAADSRSGGLKELSLIRCVALWGWNPPQLAAWLCADGGGEGGGDAAPPVAADAASSPLSAAIGTADVVAAAAAPAPSSASTNVQRLVPVANQLVAIPVVPRKYLAFLAARQRVYREITVMCRLPRHPHILALRHVCELVEAHQSRLFLMLEIATGGNLFDRVAPDVGLDEPVAARYMWQLLDGVAFCHLHGVAHRDLKLENVLIADGGDVDADADSGDGGGVGGGGSGESPGEAARRAPSPSLDSAIDTDAASPVFSSVTAALVDGACAAPSNAPAAAAAARNLPRYDLPGGHGEEMEGDGSAPVPCLKIADFGLSAVMEVADRGSGEGSLPPPTPIHAGMSPLPSPSPAPVVASPLPPRSPAASVGSPAAIGGGATTPAASVRPHGVRRHPSLNNLLTAAAGSGTMVAPATPVFYPPQPALTPAAAHATIPAYAPAQVRPYSSGCDASPLLSAFAAVAAGSSGADAPSAGAPHAAAADRVTTPLSLDVVLAPPPPPPPSMTAAEPRDAAAVGEAVRRPTGRAAPSAIDTRSCIAFHPRGGDGGADAAASGALACGRCGGAPVGSVAAAGTAIVGAPALTCGSCGAAIGVVAGGTASVTAADGAASVTSASAIVCDAWDFASPVRGGGGGGGSTRQPSRMGSRSSSSASLSALGSGPAGGTAAAAATGRTLRSASAATATAAAVAAVSRSVSPPQAGATSATPSQPPTPSPRAPLALVQQHLQALSATVAAVTPPVGGSDRVAAAVAAAVSSAAAQAPTASFISSPNDPPPRSPYLTRLKTVVGSPFYVAPEVVAAAPGGYDATKADAWSLGVIMHAIVAGALPFQHNVKSCSRYAKYAAWMRERDAALDAIAAAELAREEARYRRAAETAAVEGELSACLRRRAARRDAVKAAAKAVKAAVVSAERGLRGGLRCTRSAEPAPASRAIGTATAAGGDSAWAAAAPPTAAAATLRSSSAPGSPQALAPPQPPPPAPPHLLSFARHSSYDSVGGGSESGAASPKTVLSMLAATRLARTPTTGSSGSAPAGGAATPPRHDSGMSGGSGGLDDTHGAVVAPQPPPLLAAASPPAIQPGGGSVGAWAAPPRRTLSAFPPSDTAAGLCAEPRPLHATASPSPSPSPFPSTRAVDATSPALAVSGLRSATIPEQQAAVTQTPLHRPIAPGGTVAAASPGGTGLLPRSATGATPSSPLSRLPPQTPPPPPLAATAQATVASPLARAAAAAAAGAAAAGAAAAAAPADTVGGARDGAPGAGTAAAGGTVAAGAPAVTPQTPLHGGMAGDAPAVPQPDRERGGGAAAAAAATLPQSRVAQGQAAAVGGAGGASGGASASAAAAATVSEDPRGLSQREAQRKQEEAWQLAKQAAARNARLQQRTKLAGGSGATADSGSSFGGPTLPGGASGGSDSFPPWSYGGRAGDARDGGSERHGKRSGSHTPLTGEQRRQGRRRSRDGVDAAGGSGASAIRKRSIRSLDPPPPVDAIGSLPPTHLASPLQGAGPATSMDAPSSLPVDGDEADDDDEDAVQVAAAVELSLEEARARAMLQAAAVTALESEGSAVVVAANVGGERDTELEALPAAVDCELTGVVAAGAAFDPRTGADGSAPAAGGGSASIGSSGAVGVGADGACAVDGCREGAAGVGSVDSTAAPALADVASNVGHDLELTDDHKTGSRDSAAWAADAARGEAAASAASDEALAREVQSAVDGEEAASLERREWAEATAPIPLAYAHSGPISSRTILPMPFTAAALRRGFSADSAASVSEGSPGGGGGDGDNVSVATPSTAEAFELLAEQHQMLLQWEEASALDGSGSVPDRSSAEEPAFIVDDDADAHLQQHLEALLLQLRFDVDREQRAPEVAAGGAGGAGAAADDPPPFPSWFFRASWSDECKELLAGLLHPDPERRWSVQRAMHSKWVTRVEARGGAHDEPGLGHGGSSEADRRGGGGGAGRA